MNKLQHFECKVFFCCTSKFSGSHIETKTNAVFFIFLYFEQITHKSRNRKKPPQTSGSDKHKRKIHRPNPPPHPPPDHPTHRLLCCTRDPSCRIIGRIKVRSSCQSVLIQETALTNTPPAFICACSYLQKCKSMEYKLGRC